MHDLTSSTRARRLHGDEGASLVEYTLLLALIALVCVVALSAFGDARTGSLSKSGSALASAGN